MAAASEADTRANFIDPDLLAVGWGSQQIIREYYFTDGRKLAGDQRGSRCFVDYLLRAHPHPGPHQGPGF